MLALIRKEGTRIRIGDDIIIEIVSIRGRNVVVGIEAPRGVPVYRQEIYDRIQQAYQERANECSN